VSEDTISHVVSRNVKHVSRSIRTFTDREKSHKKLDLSVSRKNNMS